MWATPNTLDSLPPKSPAALHREATVVRPGRSKPSNLRDQVSNMHMWPTATAYKGWSPGHNRANTDDRPDYSVEREAFTIGQQTPPMRLSPYWVEWLMNFPIGFTKIST
jgi:hypothetical protein